MQIIMKLTKFHLVYFPPVIVLEFIQSSRVKVKAIDLIHLNHNSNVEQVLMDLMQKEKLITEEVAKQVKECIRKLIENLQRDHTGEHRYYIYKTLQTHLLPLTNVVFDKQGTRCVTGSYDRRCKIWNLDTGQDMVTLEGHKNVVYSVAFNNPTCDRVVSGSFDKTAKVWHADTGECLTTLWGHKGEVVCALYNSSCDKIATASMDFTAKIFDSYTGQESHCLNGHTAELIALHFNQKCPNMLVTGSFDANIHVWDVRTKNHVMSFSGHEAGISNCLFNWSGDLIGSGSFDSSVKLWDVRAQCCIVTFTGHTDEVLDVAFDNSGRKLASCSADCTARVYEVVNELKEISVMKGHAEEVSKVNFSPAGYSILTASADSTAMIWNCESGNCIQVLSGHRGEVFSCGYSYLGDTVVTASKDNTCRVWR